MSACDACLARAELLGMLGPRIARVQPSDEDSRPLLALSDDQLVRAVAPEAADRMLTALERFDASVMREAVGAADLTTMCIHEDAYPSALEPLADAPRALFVRGDVGALGTLEETPAVALVGGRRASPYALEIAQELGRCLGVAGVPVISGLALGVDAAAHRGTLAGTGRAIAVLASGADVVYPRRHRDLYRRIAETGAVISEMPPGTGARRWAFPARNRIMAGLAEMTVVVEAAESSGSLITATFAQELGREVGAVPGRINVRSAAGSNRLIAEGAAMVLRAEDILDRIFHAGARPLPSPPRIELDATADAVLEAVEAGELPGLSGELDVREVRVALGRLEGLGLVRRDGLGRYERTGMRYQRA